MATTLTSTAVQSAAWLADQIVAARILPEDRCQLLLSAYQGEQLAGDARGFADYLTRDSTLSVFQANSILAGDARRLLLGPYLLQAPLPGGSLGTVYRAVRIDADRPYAVKTLPLRSIWHVHLAKRQVETFAALPEHPSIVPLVDIDTANGVHYLAWPFVPGEPIERLVQRRGPIPVAEAVKIAITVAESLALLHRYDIAHGCLRPSKILIDRSGQCRLIDLGAGAILAENIAEDEGFLDTISTATAAAQNIDCTPPETIADPTCRTIQGDQYAFGCTLTYLLTGQYPFPGGNLVDKMIAHQTQEPVPLSEVNPKVPVSLSEIVARLMRKNPRDRYSSLNDVLLALRAAPTMVAIGTVEAPVPSPPDLAPDAPVVWETVSQSRLMPRSSRPQSDGTITFDVKDTEAETDNSYGVASGKPKVGSTGQLNPPSVTRPTPPPDGGSGSAMALKTGSVVKPIVLKGKSNPNLHGSSENRPFGSTAGREQKGLIRTDFSIELPTPVTWKVSTPGALQQSLPPVEIPPRPKPTALSLWTRFKRLVVGGPILDMVQVSLFGPRHIVGGETVQLQAFLHHPDSFESVRTLARAFLRGADLIATGYLHADVPRETQLALHLAIANAGVADPLVTVKWRGQPLPQTFSVHVPWQSPVGITPAALSVGRDNVRTAGLPFHLAILARSM